ncbi:pentapeptide repeat-containing protein [Oscillatoria sp. FACHB-1406]|uniref:pentapeptide repeat-containing protein n=1 Tax=Oscillatoria sp. FACHB-1406 TaxID=2692846 RepID=UPI0016833124|nr:pentapeptide repeat-containing protein [Oscillatoria sp. FACHB-1406]MBD2578131.1 pentapeptide repeat-containing protein [Oscillatoria sp. FACHB-1406]
MTDSDLVQLARQGDPSAIATLFNRQLSAKGVTVKAVRERDCLLLLLESPKALNKEVAIAGMQKRLLQLNPEGIEIIRLQSLQEGSFSPIWTYEFNLSDKDSPTRDRPLEASSLSPSPKPKLESLIGVGELVLLGFGFLLFIIFCRLLHFNFFAGLFLALIPATVAYNRGRSFWAWYAYGLNLYFPATLHSAFLNGFNPYSIIALFLGGVFVNGFSDGIGTLLLVPNLIFGLIPAIIANSKKKSFINWYIYGISLFLVAFFHSILLKLNVIKTVRNHNIGGISFVGKDLTGANFQGSNLQGADFRQAKLIGVNFMNTNLSQANFSSANLWGVNFDRADLNGANLTRASNIWLRGSQQNIEKFFPWWIPVGFGLLLAQLLLWGFFFGSPLGLLVTGPLELSWDFWMAHVPFVLSCFTAGLVVSLTALTLSLNRRRSLAIALLTVLAIAAISSMARSLQLLFPAALSLDLLIVSCLSSLILLACVFLAARSLKRYQWKTYCTWIGIASAMSFWALLLLGGKEAIAHFIAQLVPKWWFDEPILQGIWFLATLAAWGALAGNLVGLLVARRSTSFRSANLSNAKFRYIDFRYADFTHANLTAVDWTGAKLKDSIAPDGRIFAIKQ